MSSGSLKTLEINTKKNKGDHLVKLIIKKFYSTITESFNRYHCTALLEKQKRPLDLLEREVEMQTLNFHVYNSINYL